MVVIEIEKLEEFAKNFVEWRDENEPVLKKTEVMITAQNKRQAMLLKNKDKENLPPDNQPIDLPSRFKRMATLNEQFFLDSSILLHII